MVSENFAVVQSGALDLNSYISMVNSFPLLSKEEELELAKSWRDDNVLSAAHRLVSSHLRLVVKIVMQFRNYGLSIMDMISEGNIGLMHAVRKFEPDLGFRLSTYAIPWIKAYVREYVIKNWSFVRVGSTKNRRKLFFSLRKLKHELMGRDQDSSSFMSPEQVKRVSEVCNVNENDVLDVDRCMSVRDVSLSSRLSRDSDAELQDFVQDGDSDHSRVFSELDDTEFKLKVVNEALMRLDDRSRDILVLRKMSESPTTLESLGNKYGISPERVRQIESGALARVSRIVDEMLNSGFKSC